MSPVAPLLSLGVSHKGATTTLANNDTDTDTERECEPSKASLVAASLGLDKDYEPPCVSMAQEVSSADFQSKSFALRRTRSMGGLLDDCVRPTTDLVGKMEDYPHLKNANIMLPKAAVVTATNASGVPSPAKQTAEPSPQFSASSSSSYSKDLHMSSTSEDDVSMESDTSTRDSTRDSEIQGQQVSFSDSHKYAGGNSGQNDGFNSSSSYHGDRSSNDYDTQSNSSSQSVPGTPELPNDDSVIQHEPERLVDYFSHDWKESDASSSWRYIVRRKDVANSARLENASWRTWTKAKYNLKTVAPERVNWLKDYDVTWLYGPLYDDHSHSLLSLSGSQENLKEAAEKANIAPPAAKTASQSSPSLPLTKPILKKKTVSELLGGRPSHMLNNHSCNGTPSCSCDYHFQKRYNNMHEHDGSEVEPSNYLRHHNYRHRPYSQSTEMISNSVNRQYSYPRISEERLDTPSVQSTTDNSSSASLLSLSMDRTMDMPRKSVSPSTRAVHFNDRVEQCIALDDFSDSDDNDEGTKTSSKSAGRHQVGGSVCLTLGSDSDSDSDSDRDDDTSNDYRQRHSYRDDDGMTYGDDDDDDDDSEDEDGLFLMVRTPSSTSLSQQHGMASALTKSVSSISSGSSHTTSTKSDRGHKHPIIAVLPAARLKYEIDEEEMAAKQTAQLNSMSHMMNKGSTSDRRPHNGPYKTYDYNSVYTSPGTSPVNSSLPSTEDMQDSISMSPASSGPSSSSSSPSVVDPHTTRSHVMGQVGLNSSNSATNLLGQFANSFSKQSGQSTTRSYDHHSYDHFIQDNAENVDDNNSSGDNSNQGSSLSNSTVKGEQGNDGVMLCSADQEALNSMAACDDDYSRSYTSGSRLGLGHAMSSAKDLAHSFWKGKQGT